MKKTIIYTLVIVVAIIGIQSCMNHYFRSNYKAANRLLHETNNLKTKPFLKAHLKNGDVCILTDSWEVDTIANKLTGDGIQYDFNRNREYKGIISISIDSVAIFETNKKIRNSEVGRIAALSLLTGFDVVLGVICLTNPKACFGSCPTFYIDEKDNFHYADAEGFSNAISPSMEYFDIDALQTKWIADSLFSITMKNEALETHCVNNVELMAYPVQKGERVYQSPANDFYLCENSYLLSKAMATEGEITELIKTENRQERFSYADKENLSSKEEIVLEFENVAQTDSLGLVLNFRQTLMTTYFIYSAIGYMGDEVGDIFAQLETNGETKRKLEKGIKQELGNIDVYIWNEKEKSWELQGDFYETGPIAPNRQFIPLENVSSKSTVKVKLVLNKGLWRIDYIGLTSIKSKVSPIKVSPARLTNKGQLDNIALNEVNHPEKHLVSMPGSEYTFTFVLPESNTNYELFLYSKGYYLEWMREHWLKDKNLLKLKQMVDNPKAYLKEQAADYKLYEKDMEEEFWGSKVDTKNFSYYED